MLTRMQINKLKLTTYCMLCSKRGSTVETGNRLIDPGIDPRGKWLSVNGVQDLSG